MESDFVLLTERERMWAEMLTQVLEDNGIVHTAVPVYGAGMTLKAGVTERLRIYVEQKDLARAQALMEELFSSESF